MLLVILEHENGQLVEAAREALTFGRVLAEKMGEDLEAASSAATTTISSKPPASTAPRPFTRPLTTFSPITAPTRTVP